MDKKLKIGVFVRAHNETIDDVRWFHTVPSVNFTGDLEDYISEAGNYLWDKEEGFAWLDDDVVITLCLDSEIEKQEDFKIEMFQEVSFTGRRIC